MVLISKEEKKKKGFCSSCFNCLLYKEDPGLLVSFSSKESLVSVSMVAVVSSQENMVSRTGRHLQRYNKGRRQVVGCIPYRYKMAKQSLSKDDGAKELQVLVITSQKGKGMLFPKGGWELDESKEGAASRETLEEAGVRGTIECELGKWSFKSKSHDAHYEGYMFPLHVQEQLDFWPEKNLRQRIWMSAQEAREVCQHWWMKEALDRLVNRLTSQQQQQQHEDQELGPVLKSMRASL